MPALRIVESGVDRSFTFGDCLVTIGRGESNTISLSTDRASRDHCRIEPLPGGAFKIVDLDSRNGTRVNGEFVAQKRLQPGDRIEIGGAVIVFDPPVTIARSTAPATRPAAPSPKPVERARVESRPLARLAAQVKPDRPQYVPRREQPPLRRQPDREAAATPRPGRLRNAVFLASAASIAAMLTVVVILPREETTKRHSGPTLTAAAPERPPLERSLESPATAEPMSVAGSDRPEPLESPAVGGGVTEERMTEGEPARGDAVAEAPVAEKTEGGELEGPEGHLSSLSHEEFYLLLADADDLARAHRYDEALRELGPAARSCPFADARRELYDRLTDLELRHRLLESILTQLAANPAAFTVEEIGQIRGADARGVDLASGARIAWSEVKPRSFLSLARLAKLGLPETLGLAGFCLESQLDSDGNALLERLIGEEPAAKPAVDALLSRKLLVDVPEGGFVVFEHRFMTPSRREQLQREAEMTRLVARIASPRPEDRREAVDGLKGFGNTGETKLREALLARRAELKSRIAGHPLTRRIETVEHDKAKLDQLRQNALALILDEYRYPYPYKEPEATPDAYKRYVEAQQEIDELVELVRAHWKATESRSVTLSSSWVALVSEWRETGSLLDELEVEVPATELPRSLPYLSLTAKDVSARTCFFTEAEARVDRITAAVRKYNDRIDSTLPKDSVDQARITNDYRVMMGRPALAISEQLVASSKKHSEEMSRLGYFRHDSPVPENSTLKKRLSNEGYVSSDASENIAGGGLSPEAAHQAWLHSSGHHRNILSDRWTEAGSGKSGPYWTQNFARRAALLTELDVK